MLDHAPPPAFLAVADACRHRGVSRTKLYRLAARDPSILVQCEGRSLIDFGRATALIASFPRGPRRPPTKPNGRGGKRRKR